MPHPPDTVMLQTMWPRPTWSAADAVILFCDCVRRNALAVLCCAVRNVLYFATVLYNCTVLYALY